VLPRHPGNPNLNARKYDADDSHEDADEERKQRHEQGVPLRALALKPALQHVSRRPARQHMMQVGESFTPEDVLEVFRRLEEELVSLVQGAMGVESPFGDELVQDGRRARIY